MFSALRSFCLLVTASLLVAPLAADEPTGSDNWWWDDDWWEDGVLYSDLENHEVEIERFEYERDGVDIPALVARPADGEAYPAILWAHGRRGLDDLAILHVKRLAARGFVVMAPDLYTGRFMETHPLDHDYELEGDLNQGLDVLLERDDIVGDRACLVSITRGGYKTLKVAVTYERQVEDVACWAGYYPHLQDPNLGEPHQVYRYANEVNQLEIPMMILIGEDEQYQRHRTAKMAADGLESRGGDVTWIEYPGVGRGFDFRNGSNRTFADDLASRDAMIRVTRFANQHLRD
ncbi:MULTISPECIES: dienelactone hydrolase family protein [unclassified Thioalkalivibrio]|uniref:dienelactone hydrolase family protein n=1 Tax=unclassified Thioalkalivibrio TaxID=2621013 RepID=UPI00036E0912|nr:MULTISPECIES: dienelactone hydrolase family protein [unclassified Thioalkalivibrio]